MRLGINGKLYRQRYFGLPSLVVNFTNTSSGYTSYSWDLGNGTPLITTIPNPAGTYATPGTYTVTLTVWSGSTSATHTQIITVHPLPNTDFYADTTVCMGQTVTFTNTTTGGSGPFSYTWSFGDGGTSTLANPTHTFPGPGYYNITLSATNAQGCTKSITKLAYVHVLTPPVIGFTGSPTTICNPPGSVSFTSSASGAGPFSYSWSFGDGGSSTLANPSHTYSSPGTYTVKLVVTDANGCKDSVTYPAYINVGSFTATFTSPATACAGSPVTFVNTSGSSTTATWNYGDGSPITTSNVHTYTTAGTYIVTAVVFNGFCNVTVTHTITILPAPVISFSINPTAPCPPPTTLTLTATVPPGSTASWTFSGGGTATGATTTKTYTSPGTKTITLTVTDANGCVSTISQNITIYDLQAWLEADPDSGCVPLAVHFTDHLYTTVPSGASPYPYMPASYTWSFGDGGVGGPSTLDTVCHTYTAPGTYTATCTAVTANGCTITSTHIIHVGTPPVISVTAVPKVACYKGIITYSVTVISGPVDGYIWLYGDGTSSTGTVPGSSHIFTDPGIFSTSVIPTYNGCKGDTFVIDSIIIHPPKAVIGATGSCTARKTITFTNLSIGATHWMWYFGDASTSTVWSPIHTYPSVGTYTVMLTTYDSVSGCRDTAYRVVNIIDIDPDFVGAPTSICKGGTVNFTSTMTGGTPSSYAWYSNGVFFSSLANPSYTFSTTTGAFTIMLVTTDANGCKDTMNKVNYVNVTAPIVNFTAAPTTICWNNPVTFSDASSAGTGTTIISHIWRFGDGFSTTTTGTTVVHTYVAAGTYTVTEVVTDNLGCLDSLVKPAYISVHHPTPGFTATPTTPCLYSPVTFTNTSTGGSTYMWYFGDGATSTAVSPTHAYAAVGTYTTKLVVTDAWGCKDSVTYINHITITKPNADFLMSDSFSVCPPLMVHFTDASTGASTYYWTFGDGNSSILPSPSDLYTSPGNYTVQLIVTDVNGCKDTAVKHVSVYGYAGAFTYSPLTGCAPLRVYFNASVSNVSSITWDFRDGTIVSSGTTDTISHVYTIPGAYVPWLILSDNTGCQNSSIGLDTIKVDAVKTKFTTFPHPVCEKGEFTFIDSSSTYWSPINYWLWTFDGLTSTLQSPTHTYMGAGTYPVSLIVKNAWGCVDTALGSVVVNPPPAIYTSPDTVVCVSDSATLKAYGGVSYTWAPATAVSCTTCNPTHTGPSTETVYTVTGTDQYGCVNTDTVRVALRTHTISTAWGDTAVCRGVQVQLHVTGGTKYSWSPNWLSNQHISNPIATPPSTQTYTVIAQLASCIPDTNYVQLQIFQLPTVDAGPDQRVLAGTVCQIEATGTLIRKQQWMPAEQLECDTCLGTPTTPMERSTTFHIDVTSANGCKARDSVRIVIFCDNSQVFIPNAFTPNKDGENDKFYPRGKGVKYIRTFRIYNRWGELMYARDNMQLNDETAGWDGSFNGEAPRPDVYVYFIEAVCYTEEPIFIKGDVTILK